MSYHREEEEKVHDFNLSVTAFVFLCGTLHKQGSLKATLVVFFLSFFQELESRSLIFSLSLIF